MWVVAIVVTGRYLIKNKTTIAYSDSGSSELSQFTTNDE